MRSKTLLFRSIIRGAFALGVCIAAAGLAGCEREERVLDVQTPEGSLEVDRNIDTGEVDVEVTDED